MPTKYRAAAGRPHTIDHYGYVDYNLAMKGQEDLRTSTQRAHRYLTDVMPNTKTHPAKKIPYPYKTDPVLENYRLLTEYKEHFKFQFDDPNMLKNPCLRRRCNFIKDLADTKFKFTRRPIKPAVSVSHEDYVCCGALPEIPPMKNDMPTIPKTTKLDLQSSKPGVSKMLDPNATTNRLVYVFHDNTAYRAGNDAITLWNWDKHYIEPKKVFPYKDAELCDNFPSSLCVKRRCEYINLLKRVPHTGMTTEVRENYTPKHNLVNEFKVLVPDPIIFEDEQPSPKTTEYSTIGSGERTEKYV